MALELYVLQAFTSPALLTVLSFRMPSDEAEIELKESVATISEPALDACKNLSD